MTCDGKLRFDTERDALAELARIMTRAIMGERTGRAMRHGEHRANRLETGTYECVRCAGWHLSSEPWGGRIVNTATDQKAALA